jgi:ABC-type uncharacterized transport system substrate-binding protein
MLLIKRFIAALSNRLAGCESWLRVLVLFALAIISPPVCASDSILVIHDGKAESANEIIQSLTQHLAKDSVAIDLLDISVKTLPENTALQAYSTIITLGSQAAEVTLNENPPTQVLSLLISKQTWSLLKHKKNGHSRSVILLDQPIERQLLLVSELFGDASSIGVLLGPYSSSFEQDIIDAAKAQKKTLAIKTIQYPDELMPALSTLTDDVDVLLAEPDALVYNKRSIQGILLLTYRSKTPVIGFSQAYSRAGAMVSLYSSTENIIQQTAEIILEQSPGNHTYFPKYFSITFNKQVARTLGLSPPDEKDLIERIQQKESSHK